MDAQAILAVTGFIVKWLRGFPWFNDWETVAVAVIAAVAMTIVGGHALDVATFFTNFDAGMTTVLAALGAGHLLAKISGGKILPRNNQFTKEVA